MDNLRTLLETRQISIYFVATILALLVGIMVPQIADFQWAINPALALMLFVTFLQVPVTELKKGLSDLKFLTALLIANFIAIPLLIAALLPLLPPDPFILLAVLLVLLCPCIDYVITFSHLGQADSRLLLSSTPILLIVQILLLPIYLKLFLGNSFVELIQVNTFIHAFMQLIVIPFILAAILQLWTTRSNSGKQITNSLSLIPVPATALVLFIIIASVIPSLKGQTVTVLQVIPIYIAFAILAPVVGWIIGRLFQLNVPANRALMFSSSTRNSLVILPLALAIPGYNSVIPVIIITQTLIELISQLVYIKIIPKLITKEW